MLTKLTLAMLLTVVVALALRSRSGESARPWLRLVRVLLPSWRFFDEAGPVLRLAYRTVHPAAEPGPFRTLSLPRAPHALLRNERHNLRLAYYTLLERLVSELDPADADAARALVSYTLVERLVRHHLPTAVREREGTRFQFRVSAHDPSTGDEAREQELLVSALHAV